MRKGWTSWLVPLGLSFGCIVEAPGGGRNAPGRERAVVSQVPPLELKTGANLEDKVEVVGATVAPGRVLPGEAFRVKLAFKVLGEMDIDYQVFVHVDDAEGRTERLNADHPPAGGSYPTSQWKKGETVMDEFSVQVPAGMSVRGLNLYVGFWDPRTDARLRLKNPEQVSNDGNNRILLAKVPVGR